MSEVVDLWPELNFEKIRSPKTVLKEQGEILAQKTNNVLRGEITILKNNHNPKVLGELLAVFYIVAPFLDNYKYNLVTIFYHSALVYPATSESHGKKFKNEEELRDFLKEIFGSPETMRIINSLYSQSLEETENV